ncbi:hypothetical protein BVRB_7g162210 [Beta vulgaris subsp. vulgaris]|uniref:putative serine/threonine-protein kinase n=1 Tax=Beta vulgaris subsp. vulgaris TaxID=3555 RepID=UPI00053FAEA9|nr:putative serine/threonine-protein kinase [Beta vulgaris subsp. vulgaris]KMT06298.1 hypothetical protein BVRB_7g162210 [Beta vulgaris subsp. vulgaris]
MKGRNNLTFCSPCFSASHSFSGDEFSPGASSLQGFRVFSYKELKIATGGFRSSNKVGEGSFGSVYKGFLQDGSTVAVKVLSVELESLQGEREFISEITALADIKHENLITLRGCCISGANRFLIYDYMENNSLALSFLGNNNTRGYESRKKFGWKMRRDISLGIARGFAFLHEEINPHIVHRDIKPANILLDKNFLPKIADFGLSKLFTNNTSHVSTRVAGTLGYIAPEYAITGHLTRKSDVYSFGVLLLHLVSGLSVVEFDLEQGDTYLVDKAWKEYKANNLQSLVDAALDQEFPEEEATRVLKVGLLCVQETASLRPLMSAVVKMLTDATSMKNVSISKPGHLPDLMHLKVGHNHSPCSSDAYSNSSTFN